ncbi:MAG TPA: hypothetical protein VN641_22745 [Urbifossiella sp.]|nr:hypothetical protein [Urbifossiella sp.]
MTRPSQRYLFPFALLVLAALSFLRYLPDLLAFPVVMFGDAGWPLAVDAMLDDGLVPTRDFGYFYGLLALAIDRVWFVVAGRTPEAAVALMAVGSLGIAIGMLRWANAAGMDGRARLLLLAAVPVAIMPLPYPTAIHAIEAALLVNALASQASGRYAAALAFATAAVFVKPGLGYVHGLILVVLILRGYERPGWRGRLRAFVPAASLGVVLAAAFIAWWGASPLVDTLFPTRAAENYRDERYGFFFGEGRGFWLPESIHPLFYLLSPAGFWLVATLLLTAAAVERWRRRDPQALALATCAILHVAFVLFLFGNRWSWLYYSAILVCGVAAALGSASRLNWFLAALAIAGQWGPYTVLRHSWQTLHRSEATAGLYATTADAELWGRVRDLAHREKVMVFSKTGGAFVVFPEMDSSRVWFLLRSTATKVEIDRVKGQLREATWLVLPYAGEQALYPRWPEFSDELDAFALTEGGDSFQLWQRR